MSCFFLPLTFLMGQCAVFCLLQHVTHIFTPYPFADAVFHDKKDGGMWWGKHKGSACHTFSLVTRAASMTLIKKNNLLKEVSLFRCTSSSSTTITGSCYKTLIVNHDKALHPKPSKQKLFI